MRGAMTSERRGGPPRSPQVSPAFDGGLAARSSTGLVRSSRNPNELAKPGLIFLRKYVLNALSRSGQPGGFLRLGDFTGFGQPPAGFGFPIALSAAVSHSPSILSTF